MNCSDAKLLIGADPTSSTPDLEAHLATCAQCRAYQDEMRVLDGHIRRVLLTAMPAAGSRPAAAVASAAAVKSASTRRTSRSPRQWMALAASVLIVLVAAVVGWRVWPAAPLAEDVVAHMSHEPQAWTAAQAISPTALNVVLSRSGVQLSPQAGTVTYANSCWFRKKWTPHLVVQTSQGPLTVLILPGEHATRVERFHENGLSGFIVPAQRGSVAVLTRGTADIDAQARSLAAAVRWTGES